MYLSDTTAALEIRGRIYHSATLGVSALLMAVGWLPFFGGFGVPELAQEAALSLLR